MSPANFLFRKLTEQVKQLTGRVDILINNAGVSQRSYALNTSIEVDQGTF